jgi:hypothetical protein
MKQAVIKSILETSAINEYNKRDLIKAIAEAPEAIAPSIEVEKYRIDKMLEAGLLKAKTARELTIEKVVTTLLDKKFAMVYIATLSFLLMLFNSSNFWKWMMNK